MKKLLKVFLFIWTVFFFPVSCTFFGAVGALVYSEFDARNVANGEEPHSSLFYVIAKIRMDGEEYYEFKSLNELERIQNSDDKYSMKDIFDNIGYDRDDLSNCRNTSGNSATVNPPFNKPAGQHNYEYTFLLPNQKGEFSTDSEYYRYEVKNLSDRKQLIEVFFVQEDYKSTSRYIAEAQTVTPVYSKILEPGYGFISLPAAIVLSSVLMFVGRHYRKKWLPLDAPKKYSIQSAGDIRREKLRTLEGHCPYCKFNLRSGKNKCDECGKGFKVTE